MQLTNKDFQNSVFNINESTNIDLLLNEIKNKITINVNENLNVNLNIKNINILNDIEFNLDSNSILNIRLINENLESKISINSNLKEGSEINYYYVDFSNRNSNLNITTNLNERKSKGTFKFSSVSFDELTKKCNILFNQNAKETESLFEGYGVAKNASTIDVKGISTIKEKCIKSIANQKVKVILFDKESKAKASPTLKINCDDIFANHACAVGHLNADHIFYLKSRGLSEEEARKLITVGFLLPIDKYFDETDKKTIDKYIEENF